MWTCKNYRNTNITDEDPDRSAQERTFEILTHMAALEVLSDSDKREKSSTLLAPVGIGETIFLLGAAH